MKQLAYSVMYKSFASWSHPYGRPVPEQKQLVRLF
jgi:hypothetical protein